MLRISHCPKLGEVPLSAPHGIGIEHTELWLAPLNRHLTDCSVMLRICTIDIAAHATTKQRMIQTGIELYHILLALCLDSDA